MFRSILFSIVITMVALFAILYIALSIPAVVDSIKSKAETELSRLFTSRVEIGDVEIFPFNEVRLHGVNIYDPSGQRCIYAARIGAGISLWQLLSSGDIEITYAEIIGLNADISQSVEGGPLNIDFIIKAFAKKDDNKLPTKFSLALKNVVIRKSSLSFSRLYKPHLDDPERFDPNYIKISQLQADIQLPLLSNDKFEVDLRRLAFRERCGLDVKRLSLYASISPEEIALRNFQFVVNNTKLTISDQSLPISGYKSIAESLSKGVHSVDILLDPLVPADFHHFLPSLATIDDNCSLHLLVSGNAERLTVDRLSLRDNTSPLSLDLEGEFAGLKTPKTLSGEVQRFELSASPSFLSNITKMLNINDPKVGGIISSLGNVSIDLGGNFNLANSHAQALCDVETDAGDLSASGNVAWGGAAASLQDVAIKVNSFDLGKVLNNNMLGLVSLDAQGSALIGKGVLDGDAKVSIPFVDFKGTRFENIALEASKSGQHIAGHVDVGSNPIDLLADADVTLDGVNSQYMLNAEIDHFAPASLGVATLGSNGYFSGNVDLKLSGNSVTNLLGDIDISNLNIVGKKSLSIDDISISSEMEGETRRYTLLTDFLTGRVEGDLDPTQVPRFVGALLSQVAPAVFKPVEMPEVADRRLDLIFQIQPDDQLYSFINFPNQPMVPVAIEGCINGGSKSLELMVNAPYLMKGKKKLIKDTKVKVTLRDATPARVSVDTSFPMKNDVADAHILVEAFDNVANTDLKWQMKGNDLNIGNIMLKLGVERDQLSNNLDLHAAIREGSGFTINDARWTIYPATIDFANKSLSVNDLRISHDLQYLKVSGKASADPMDVISADLAGIDLEYIFDILNINHVNFGGLATGKAFVSGLFGGGLSATLSSDGLFVKDFKYNDCLFGDAKIDSHWDNEQKMVAIDADIRGEGETRTGVHGGIYVTRDSLSLQFDARKVDLSFLQPIMSGISSSVSGRASGKVKLYGTFSNIDLDGYAYAEPFNIKIDHTNVTYSGYDSVFFTPGRIYMPHLRIEDKFGNSGEMTGEVRHSYLGNARFRFDASNLKHILVYDKNYRQNPNWYGQVFASGSASLRGEPGIINLDMTMTTDDKSEFNISFDENETAVEYSFLTFSDRRREAEEAKIVVEETIEDKLRKQFEKKKVKDVPSLFTLDMALDITPATKIILVMDAKSGDKIVANGIGAMQLHYDTDVDNLSIYGKYMLDHGNYNFSLQDVILKNFKIRQGSTISFNGDPGEGILDITAAYRVTTDLADLDLSFRNDVDLNRTNVPVDALLKVSGEVSSPEVNFDIDLPTVTSEVHRKVKSIISTDDMLNRQVIYLLALNRFYTPEYTGAEQGGEFASVASSTLSSQIQNILGSLTDKFSVAPSFKSEKSDLSDIEVDVALSSSLFDNRLLLNGNFGYRDKSTSNTTFVGDFDLEYLLSRDGRFRLKAYNHFNDASYYLKSALTTQGIGLVFRKDFDDPFKWIKRMFRRKKKLVPEPIAEPIPDRKPAPGDTTSANLPLKK